MTERTSAAPAGRALRLGVLVDSLRQPRWLHALLSDVRASAFCELALVVCNGAPRTDGAATPAGRTTPSLRHPAGGRWLYAAYERLDAMLFRVGRDALEITNIDDVVAGCPLLRVRASGEDGRDDFEAADADAIRRHDLDVALRLGFRTLAGRALCIAKHGVWELRYGDGDSDGSAAGVWEVLTAEPTTAAGVYVVDGSGRGVAIDRTVCRTDRRSIHRNRSQTHWAASRLLLRKLRDLHEVGPTELPAGAGDRAPGAAAGHRGSGVPTNTEVLTTAMTLGARLVRNRIARVGASDQWFIAYRVDDAPPCSDDDAPSLALDRMTHLMPPPDRFWADPFPASVNGRHYIFVEEVLYAHRRGRIAVLEIGRDARPPSAVPVLERDYHLSYPFLFEWRGERFMMPETSANRTVELYRARSFPYEWEPHSVLLGDVSAADATLAEVDGRWWLFSTVATEPDDANAAWNRELHLFHAPTPLGPFTPHRGNPVKSDVRSARPAGRLFRRAGEYYRPAQDCAERYGHAVAINRITRLDTRDFREVTVQRILPQWSPNLVGTHTINAAGGLTVVDGRVRLGGLRRSRTERRPPLSRA